MCAVEIEEYPRKVLMQRQDDGILPPFPIWDDVQTFDGGPWRGIVDVVSGGFPCQDISAAGKGAGIEGERSGLWGEMARIIREVGPRFVFVENSPLLVGRGLAVVIGDLAEMGYDARWGIVGAHHAGAPHKRDRCWIVADSCCPGTGDKGGEAGDEKRRAGGEYVPPLRQGDGADGADRVGAASEGAGDVADTRGGRLDRRSKLHGESEQSEQQTPLGNQPDGLCDTVAFSDETGLQGFAGDGADGDEPGRDRTQEGRSFTEAGLCGGAEDAADSDSINGRPGTGREDGAEIGDSSTPVGNTNQNGCNKGRESLIATWSHGFIGADWWKSEPELGRVADGVAGRVDRLKAIGNGQVPAVAALAWDILTEEME